MYEARGNYIVTSDGDAVKRPRVLPQDRYLVSNATDGVHYRAYRRAGLLWRLFHGTRWRCISGKREWLHEYDAWVWVESQCVNRAFGADDWHGVGYARYRQDQTSPGASDNPFRADPWLHSFTLEPRWVHDLYRNGPPHWVPVGGYQPIGPAIDLTQVFPPRQRTSAVKPPPR